MEGFKGRSGSTSLARIALLIGVAVLLSCVMFQSAAFGGNRVINGDFTSGATGWTTWLGGRGASGNVSYTATGTTVLPTGGAGQCMRVTSTSFNGGAYQQLSLVSGQVYTISVSSRQVTAGNLIYAEVHVGTSAPVQGSDYSATCLQKWQNWNGGCPLWNSVNGGCVTNTATFTATSNTMYLTLKAGNGTPDSVDISYDNVSVTGPDPCTPPATPGVPTLSAATTTGMSVTDGTDTAPDCAIKFGTLFVQSGGTLGASAVWQPKATWGTKAVTGLTVNTQYSVTVAGANDASGTCPSVYGAAATKYTLANTPTAPTISGATATTLNAAIGGSDGNPAATTYAIHIAPAVGGNSWVQANGTIGASAVYQASATWATKTVTGLASSTTYTFYTQAQNGDAVATATGTTATGTTSAADTTAPAVTNIYPASNTCLASGATFTPTATETEAGGLTAATQYIIGDPVGLNLLANPGFETTSLTGWTNTSPNPYGSNNGYPTPTASKEGTKWVGSSNGGATASPELRQTVTVTAGTPYFFSVWVCTDGSPNACSAFLKYYNGTAGADNLGTTVASFTTNTPASPKWNQLCGIVTPTGTTLTYILKLSWASNGGGNFDLAECRKAVVASSATGGPPTYTTTWPAITIAGSGALSVYAKDTAGNVSLTADSNTLNIIPATPTASNNGPICAGGTLGLSTPTVTGATYSWTGPNGFISSVQNPSIISANAAATGTYSVTVTVGGCTSAAGTTSATVNAIPSTPTAGNNGPFCDGNGQSLILTTPTVSGATYSWAGPGGFTSALQNPTISNVTSADAGDYSVTAIVSGCSSLAGTTTVVVNPAPTTPTAGASPNPACIGAALNLTAADAGTGATYSWTGPNSFTSTDQNPTITDVQAIAAGTYTVTATLNGCTSTSSIIVSPLNSAPSITTQPVGNTVCTGNAATLTVAAIGTDPLTYQWRKDGTNIDGATETSFSASEADSYDCIVTNGCGSVTSEAVTVAVNVGPSITTNPTSQAICAGSTATFTAAANGTPAPTYQWQLDGANIPSATETSYTASAEGAYTCIATNGCGSVTSTGATLTVNTAPSITAQPVSQTTCAGNTVTFTVGASGTGPLTYQWRKDGTNIGDATTSGYTTGNIGSYDCIVTNGCGSVTSNAAGLTNSGVAVSKVFMAKAQPDETQVSLSGPVVTMSFGDYYYIADTDRSAAIRVNVGSGTAPLEGVKPIICGIVRTINGERVIDDAFSTANGTTDIPKPLAMINRSANHILASGQLVALWGIVSVPSGATDRFTISDGSPGSDLPTLSVVIESHGVTLRTDGSFQMLIGVLGAEPSGPVLRIK